MVTPKERKLLTNLRDIKGRKIWVLCSWRSWRRLGLEALSPCWPQHVLEVCMLGRWHSRNEVIATVFPTVHKSAITFSKLRSRFQSPSAFHNSSSVPHLFHFFFPFSPVCTPLMKTFPCSLCACHTYPVPVGVASVTFPPLPDICRFALVCFPPVSQGYSVNRSPDKTAHFHSL